MIIHVHIYIYWILFIVVSININQPTSHLGVTWSCRLPNPGIWDLSNANKWGCGDSKHLPDSNRPTVKQVASKKGILSPPKQRNRLVSRENLQRTRVYKKELRFNHLDVPKTWDLFQNPVDPLKNSIKSPEFWASCPQIPAEATGSPPARPDHSCTYCNPGNTCKQFIDGPCTYVCM